MVAPNKAFVHQGVSSKRPVDASYVVLPGGWWISSVAGGGSGRGRRRSAEAPFNFLSFPRPGGLAADSDTTHFKRPVAESVQCRTDLGILRAKILVATTRASGAVEARQTQLNVVHQDFGRVVSVIQQVADTLPHDGAAELITSMMLTVSKRGSVHAPKPELAVKQGALPGTVNLVALALGRKVMYAFEYSLDQKSWTAVPNVQVAHTTVTGLTPGQVYYFRFSALVKNTPRPYSQIVSFLVK